MTTIALSAHFDGEKIKLDEPHQLPANARLVVVVLPEDDERQEWSSLHPTSGESLRRRRTRIHHG